MSSTTIGDANRLSDQITAQENEPMTTRVVDVLVPVALDQTYSYRVPAGLDVAPAAIQW